MAARLPGFPEEPMDYVCKRLPRMQWTDHLSKGDLVGARFEVDRKLGQGGFGQVYETYDHLKQMPVAVKTFVGRQAWKIETHYLKTFQAIESIPAMISTGTVKVFQFVAMDMLGPNLDYINTAYHGLSKRTVIYLSLNILDCLFEIHDLGYIHGDIKPTNIAIGAPPDGIRKIYIYDFSVTKKITNPQTPANTLGTLAYAGLPRHRGQTPSVLDDYYSFLYTILDLRCALPWTHTLNRNEVFANKARFTDGLLSNLHPNFLKFKKYLDSCKHYHPSQRLLKNYVISAMSAEKFEFQEPFEWEMFPDRLWEMSPQRTRPLPAGFRVPHAEEEEPVEEPPVDIDEAGPSRAPSQVFQRDEVAAAAAANDDDDDDD